MFRKIFSSERSATDQSLAALLEDAGVAPRRRALAGRVLTVVGASVAGTGLLAGGALAVCAQGLCAFGDGLRAAAEGAQTAGFGLGAFTVLGAVTAGIGVVLTRLERLADDAQRLADESPDLRPALEGLAARQRQTTAQFDALQQRVAAMPPALQGMLSGGLQSIEMGVESRVAAMEEQMLERLEALQANQPTEALWRLAASLDRLGMELERRIERRLGQHVDGLDERLSALAESARSALANAPRPVQERAAGARAAEASAAPVTPPPPPRAPAPGPAARVEPPAARAIGSEPSLAAQLRSFTPGNDEDPQEPLTFDLDATPSVDLYGAALPGSGDDVFDLSSIEEDLSASLEILDQADPFSSPTRSRAVGPPPTSGTDRRPEPPAALPKPRQPAPRPTADRLDLRDGSSRA